MLRIILAFIAAPLLPSLMVIAIAQLPGVASLPVSPVTAALSLAALSPLAAVPATVVFGIPIFFLFRAKGWLHLHHAILAGGAVGLASFACVWLVSSSPAKPGYDTALFAIGTSFGMLMGAIFWFVGLWKPKRGRTQQE